MTRQEPEHRAAGQSDADGGPVTAAASAGPFDVDHPPPLDFASWTAMAARLLERAPVERFEILTERDLDPGLWDRCEAYWAEQLAGEIGTGDMRRATDYARRCADELAARRRAKPAPSVDETAWLVAPVVVPALPFSSTEPSPAPGPIVRPAEARLDLAGETQTIGPRTRQDAPLPFVPALSLEQYAALCAKLAVAPADAVGLARSYGIADAPQLQATHMGWIRRFDQEPDLRAAFQRLEQRLRVELQGATGKTTGRRSAD
jgi:hypothetical protein